MSDESWAPVFGYEGHYEISSCGDVVSVGRYVQHGRSVDGVRFCKPAKKKSFKNPMGYVRVQLSKDGRNKFHSVHRLVLLSFMYRDDADALQVNHKNGIRDDNSLANLEWVTAVGNAQHKIHVLKTPGSMKGRFGEDHNQAVAVVALDIPGNFVRRYGSMADAERDGFIASAICECVKGKSRTHLGLRWVSADKYEMTKSPDPNSPDDFEDSDEQGDDDDGKVRAAA